MMPTAAAEQVLLLAEGLRKQHTGASDIFRLLCEDTGEARAFFCSFETFRSIVMLERRHLARSKGDSALVMAGLDSGAVPGTDMRRLERILSEGLRTGDPASRLGSGSYVFLLPGADTEKAQIVISRLDRAFHKTYRHSKARLTYHISLLTPQEEEK